MLLSASGFIGYRILRRFASTTVAGSASIEANNSARNCFGPHYTGKTKLYELIVFVNISKKTV